MDSSSRSCTTPPKKESFGCSSAQSQIFSSGPAFEANFPFLRSPSPQKTCLLKQSQTWELSSVHCVLVPLSSQMIEDYFYNLTKYINFMVEQISLDDSFHQYVRYLPRLHQARTFTVFFFYLIFRVSSPLTFRRHRSRLFVNKCEVCRFWFLV